MTLELSMTIEPAPLIASALFGWLAGAAFVKLIETELAVRFGVPRAVTLCNLIGLAVGIPAGIGAYVVMT